jgi:hypothetical protein
MDASRRAFTEGNEENKDSNLAGYKRFLRVLPLARVAEIPREGDKGTKGA